MSLATAFRIFGHGKDSVLPASSRLRDWWQGETGQPLPEMAVSAEDIPEGSADNPFPDLANAGQAGDVEDPWPQERLALLAELWGPGFTTPGGEEFTIELIKPLAPTSAMSLLNLDAHLGGSARTIANVYQMWVNAFESDERLARIGMEISEREGMVKRAPVEFCDREALGEQLTQDRRQYDCVFSKDGFYRVANKDDLFEGIYKHLKQNGQFLFTDYVLPEGGEADPEVVAGLTSEKGMPHLWTVKQTLKSINRFEFELHISEDMTVRYRGMIVHAWALYVQRLRQQKLTPAMGDALLREVEIWVRRVLAMDRGGLRVHRIHAVKRASGSF